LRLRDREGVPEGGGDGRTGAEDGGKVPPAQPGHRNGQVVSLKPEDVDTILVVDFGAQYAQLIARRVREANVYSEIVPRDMPVAQMLAKNPKAIILSGGPASVFEPGAPSTDPAMFDSGVPVFGICYGFQSMTQA